MLKRSSLPKTRGLPEGLAARGILADGTFRYCARTPRRYARLRINEVRACSARRRAARLNSSPDKTARRTSACAGGRSR
jgi:hypothetical protein